MLSFTNDGNSIQKNLTDVTGVNYSLYKANPSRYDDMLQNYIDSYFVGLEKTLIQNSQVDINDHKVNTTSTATSGDYINWSKVSYRFGFN